MNLDQLSILSLDKEISEYEKNLESLPEPVFSNKHHRIIKKATKVSRKRNSVKTYGERRLGFYRKAFVIAMVASLIMVTTVAAFAKIYPSYYMVIKKKITEWTLTFVHEENGEEIPVTIGRKGITPDGFNITSSTVENDVNTITYSADENESKQIIFVEQKIDGASSIGIDAETEDEKKMQVNGNSIIVTRKDDCYTFFWINKGFAYTLVGNCEEETLIKYVETIR